MPGVLVCALIVILATWRPKWAIAAIVAVLALIVLHAH
jgi:hypothetical protein